MKVFTNFHKLKILNNKINKLKITQFSTFQKLNQQESKKETVDDFDVILLFIPYFILNNSYMHSIYYSKVISIKTMRSF